MYFITTKRMLEVCFSAHPNIQYRTAGAAGRLDGNDSRINAPASISSVHKMRVAVFQKAGMVCVSNGSISGHRICCCLLCLGGVRK
ncbi:Uncharacterised protein [[Clostridium] symbiosum]|nr:Uncharacterised protein [[Clostridium] symbiosum]